MNTVNTVNRTVIGIGAAAMLALSAVLPQAHAQKMYHCGTIYQDRPCDGSGGGAIGKTGTPAPAPQPVSVSSSDQKVAAQKKLRCENYARQVDELHDRQNATPKDANMYDAQIKSLEGRMKGDSC